METLQSNLYLASPLKCIANLGIISEIDFRKIRFEKCHPLHPPNKPFLPPVPSEGAQKKAHLSIRLAQFSGLDYMFSFSQI